MKIDSSGSIRPPKFGDVDINKIYGTRLGKFSEDAVRAIVLREVEVRAAMEIRQEWVHIDAIITSDLEVNTERSKTMFGNEWASALDEVIEYLRADRAYLNNERVLARGYIALCNKVIDTLAAAPSSDDLTHAYGADGPRQGMALRYLEGSLAAARRLTRRMDAAEKAWDEGYDRIVAQATRRNKFVGSSGSRTLAQIDALSGESFEETNAWLLQRDGCTIVRYRGGPGDQGADVIAITPAGLRIVLQCKHSTKEGKRLSPPPVHELNGTARQVHGADIVGIVTNRELSEAAMSFAIDQDIHIVDRRVLKRWATYGVPWWQPEELPVPAAAEPEEPVMAEAA